MSSLPELVLKRLRPPDETAFGTLVSLYDQSFPESERKPISALRRMLDNCDCHFLLAFLGNHIIGFAIAHVLSGSPAAMLEYMAVVPTHRNRGLGRQLFLSIAQSLEAPPRTLFLELESDYVESSERTRRSRRKRFYHALGAREIGGLHWVMPPVVPEAPPPMEMMVFPVSAVSISKLQLHQALTSIYVEVYGQSSEDPRIDTMLHPLPNEVPLR